jgi:hypothetical protein
VNIAEKQTRDQHRGTQSFFWSSNTDPLEGLTNPAIVFKIVDLPHPDGPNKQMNSPGFIMKLISSSTKV